MVANYSHNGKGREKKEYKVCTEQKNFRRERNAMC